MTAAPFPKARRRPAAIRPSPVMSAVFVAVLCLCVARALVGGSLLDLVMNYRADEGSIVEKIHPAFYVFAAIVAFVLASVRVELSAWETSVVRAMLAFVACIAAVIAYTVAFHIGSSVGFLVDNYVGACFSASLFFFSPPQRRLIGRALLVVMVLSAAVAILEFLLKTSLLPHPGDEATFRPVGLTSHPLELGLWCAVAIPLTTLSGWSRRANALCCLVLFCGLAVSGARTAMLAGGASALVVAVASVAPQPVSRRRLERRLIVAISVALAAPLVGGALYAAGALDRFSDANGEDSAQARVVVFRVFDYMSWPDMLLGIGTQRLTDIATVKLKLFAVESAVVIFVALFGLFGAVLLAVAFSSLLIVMLRGARPAAVLATALFIGVALSNNALASKEPSVFTLLCCIIAFRSPAPHGDVTSD